MGLEPAPAVRVTEPVSYLKSLSLEADARAVLTDSGGVQGKTTYLGVPCVEALVIEPATVTNVLRVSERHRACRR